MGSSRQNRPNHSVYHSNCGPLYMFVLPLPAAGPKWLPGVVRQVDGCSCWIELLDGRSFRRHFDHVRPRQSNFPDIQLGRPQPELPAVEPPASEAVGRAHPATDDCLEMPDPSAISSPERSADVERRSRRSSTAAPLSPVSSAVAPALRRSERVRRCPTRFQAGQPNPVAEECGDLALCDLAPLNRAPDG